MNPLAEIAGRPWAMHPGTFESLLRNLDSAAPGIKLPTAPGRKRVEDGVAIIDITGTITPRATILSLLFGGTDLQTVQGELDVALADSSVKKIVLNVDSPGGAVAGVSELADRIYAARSIKPVEAFVSGMGASAAYWLAAAAGRIVVSDTAQVGSIGVVGTVLDDRVRQGMQGVTFHEIVSSNAPKKRPDPLTPEGRNVLQTEIDSIASVFTAKVARYRGVPEETVNRDFGQGGSLVGAAAVRAGMADVVGAFDSILAAPGVTAGAVPAAAATQIQAAASVEDACAAQWRSDPKVRAEFGTLESFTAYTRAESTGRARAITGRVVSGR